MTHDRIKDMANDIFNVLGHGHSEAVYQAAFLIALQDANLPFETERVIPVTFRNRQVGTIRADIIVNHELVIELKSVPNPESALADTIEQCRMYMRYTNIDHGLVILFPRRPTALLIEHVVL
jgi:GxxExxY protein